MDDHCHCVNDDCYKKECKIKNMELGPQKQPGQYLCVDTRKETTKSSFGMSSRQSPRQSSVQFSRPVHPDSLCKLKTTLAINYVKSVSQMCHQHPVHQSRSKVRKKPSTGRLRPLLSNHNRNDKYEVEYLSVKNGTIELSKTIESVSRHDEIADLQLRGTSPMLTPAACTQKDRMVDVDLRSLALVELVNRMKMADCTVSPAGTEVTELKHFVENEEKLASYNIDNESEVEDGLCSDESYTHNFVDVNNNLVPNQDNFEESKKKESYFNNELQQCKNRSQIEQLNCLEESCNTDKPNHNRGNVPDGTTVTGQTKVHPQLQSQELDSIQVKDIWKALNDSGFDITREEVSRYKSRSSKSATRIKSAPVRRIDRHPRTKDLSRPFSAHRGLQHSGTSSASTLTETDLNKGLDNQKETGNTERRNSNSTSACQENLEVIAVSKAVCELPRKVKLVSPLNFKINTKPKPCHFFYFTYGLNMNHKRLGIQLRRKTGVKYWALLLGFRIVFNKKGSSEGGVGFPNILPDDSFSVEGCVYELPQECLQLLDTCVGFPNHYARLVLPVWLCNSDNPDEHGVAQHCVPAVVYIAQDDWVVEDPNTLDCSFTLKQCFLGTDILSPGYQEFLRSLTK